MHKHVHYTQNLLSMVDLDNGASKQTYLMPNISFYQGLKDS